MAVSSGGRREEQSPRQFLLETRNALRSQFREVSQAIIKLSRGEIKSFTLDTGQNSQTVTRHDLPALIQQQRTLLSMINDIDEQLGDAPVTGGQCVQVVPY